MNRGPGSVVGIATGYGLDSPGIKSRWGARFSAPVQTGPGAHQASCTMGTGSFPGVKSGRGVTLTPHTLLVLWSRKSRAIPLLPLWAVWPVQSLSSCTRVHFTFTFFTWWIDQNIIPPRDDDDIEDWERHKNNFVLWCMYRASCFIVQTNKCTMQLLVCLISCIILCVLVLFYCTYLNSFWNNRMVIIRFGSNWSKTKSMLI